MQTLVVVDAQNEFSAGGQRAVPDHGMALEAILQRVEEARREERPIAWVRHYNTPEENAGRASPAFVPGTWGAEFSPGLGPLADRAEEREFVKTVYGAFTGTDVGSWLESVGSDEVLIVGFYTHMCVSTTAREALMRGLSVSVDPDGTGATAISHELLGSLSAEEVRRSALLQLNHMGVEITPRG
ncbi:MAG TPA: isochorismatase family cysteine hydrolase [Ktedonobacterales bacterium]